MVIEPWTWFAGPAAYATPGDPPVTTVTPNLKHWNGVSWEPVKVYEWDGAAWVEMKPLVNYWDGAAWQT